MLRRQLLGFLVLLLCLPACWGQETVPGGGMSAEPARLRLGVHPYLPELYIKKRFTPLVEYLTGVLGIPVELSVSADYRSHIQRIANGDLDLAYMGPAPYVKLVSEFGPRPLIARQAVFGEPHFNGVIFVREGSRVTSLKDLKGKRFAFGDPSSTMAHLVPRSMLLEAGIGLDALGGYEFVGSHQDVALAVLRGKADAGAVKQEVYARYRHRGLRSVALTPQISEHLFVASARLSPAMVARLQDEFLALDKSTAGREALRAIKPSVTAMVPVVDADYDSLRRLLDRMREAGVKL